MTNVLVGVERVEGSGAPDSEEGADFFQDVVVIISSEGGGDKCEGKGREISAESNS